MGGIGTDRSLVPTWRAYSSSSPPVTVDAALNERDYGKLNGRNKAKVAEEYGRRRIGVVYGWYRY
jgi:bisphosphoglycerate-dependent phosphoglycerate mutase